MKSYHELDSILEEKVEVRILESTSTSWADFSRQAGQYIGFIVIYIVASFILSVIPILNIASNVITPFMPLGLATFVYFERVNRSNDFGNFFMPFRKFVDIILTQLIIIALSVVAFLPVLFFGGIEFYRQFEEAGTDIRSFNPVLPPGLILSFILSFLLLLVVAVFTYFGTYFAYFYNLKPIEAIKLSIKMGQKHLLHFIMLFLFSGFISALGVLLCCVGLLATIPISSLIVYHSFASITKLEKKEEIDLDFDGNGY